MRQMFPSQIRGADRCGTLSQVTLLRKPTLNGDLGCFLRADLIDSQADSAAGVPLGKNGSKAGLLGGGGRDGSRKTKEGPQSLLPGACTQENRGPSEVCVLPPHSSSLAASKPPPGMKVDCVHWNRTQIHNPH